MRQDVNAGSMDLVGGREYSLLLSRERPAALPPGVRDWLELKPSEGHVALLLGPRRIVPYCMITCYGLRTTY